MKGIITGPNEIPIQVDPLIHFEDKLVGGDLTADGVQYTAEITTATANVDVVAHSKTIDPLIEGTILAIEFQLDVELKAVSTATADLIWKWQARNKDGLTWVDLHSAVTETNIGTTYQLRSRSGFFTPAADFQLVPFDVRLILQCNEATQGRAKVKNSSFVRVVYKTT